MCLKQTKKKQIPSFFKLSTHTTRGLNLKNPTSKLNLLQFQVFQHHAYDPWIIESGASSHIFYKCSSFSFISSPKIPHLDTVANGSKVAYQRIGLSRSIFK